MVIGVFILSRIRKQTSVERYKGRTTIRLMRVLRHQSESFPRLRRGVLHCPLRLPTFLARALLDLYLGGCGGSADVDLSPPREAGR